MQLRLIEDAGKLGRVAAEFGASVIREALGKRAHATVIVATGASQFAMLQVLVKAPDIDWSRVTVFHLDEYIGLPESHSASFRRYLRERFLAHLPAAPEFIPVNGDAADLDRELARLNGLLSGRSVDLCFAGIGENAHLAFNDPPADFDIADPYIAVNLDEACRRQQFGEGWFKTMEDVPQRAISMSVQQIMRSQCLILTVPDSRKAAAAKCVIEGPVEPSCPASIVQRHPNCVVFLDRDAASKLTRPPGQVD
ncbi:MAG: glucosamine-6-phosphate deaminase [Variovorax sp.]